MIFIFILISSYFRGLLLGIEVFNIKIFFSIFLISGGISIAVSNTATFSVLGVVMCTLSGLLTIKTI